jgi:transcriptional regulator with XRE-family HTH domain
MAKNDAISQSIGQRIKRAREKQGLSQAELAERIGKYSSAISNYENATSMMHISEIPELVRALGISYDYLLDGVEGETTGAGKRVQVEPLGNKGNLAEIQKFVLDTEQEHLEYLKEALQLVRDVSQRERYLRDFVEDDQQDEIPSLNDTLNQFVSDLHSQRTKLLELGFDWAITGMPPKGREDEIR